MRGTWGTRDALAWSVTSTKLAGFALVLAACGFAGHGDDDVASSIPTVVSSSPVDGAPAASLDGALTATFSEAMDPSSLTAISFTLVSGTTAIAGTVSYADSIATFRPDVDLASDGHYTATITTGANSDAGVALSANYTWSFVGDRLLGPGGPPVNLGTASTYAVLAEASISGTGATIKGDLGLSPAAASYITGFSLIPRVPMTYTTSAQVTGKVYAADYLEPTPTNLGVALADLRAAYADAAGRTATTLEVTGAIGGVTLGPGVYRWVGAVTIPTSITLAGRPTDVWIFQIGTTLDVAASTEIVLANGALASNVFWQLPGAVTLGASAHLRGTVLTATSLTSGAGTLIDGRVLAQTDVTITGSTIVLD